MTVGERECAIGRAVCELGDKREEELRSSARRFADHPEADQLLHESPFARLLGILAQQHRTRPGQAWEVPWQLKNAIGRLDPDRIVNEEQAVRSAFAAGSVRGAPTTRMAEITVRAARRVIEDYDGDAARVWTTTRDPEEIRSRVDAFYGAGPKIAAMAPAVLRRGYGVPIDPGGDIAVDVNVRRVFHRTGLSDRADGDAGVRRAAREIWPDDPASLDLGTWIVGAEWCKSRRPKCHECPLQSWCRYRSKSSYSAGRYIGPRYLGRRWPDQNSHPSRLSGVDR